MKARRAGEGPKTRAILNLSKNALANSKLEELEKFVGSSGVDEKLRPTFARYTGQELDSRRQEIANLKPDILPTNFMMLELLLTRQDQLDQSVIENARGLEFLVLDELHTYRGRQGADVAMLVRRVKERLASERKSYSASVRRQRCRTPRTMKRGTQPWPRSDLKLFGEPMGPGTPLSTSIWRALRIQPSTGRRWANPFGIGYDTFSRTLAMKPFSPHPLACWIETEVGLIEGEKLRIQPDVLRFLIVVSSFSHSKDHQSSKSASQFVCVQLNPPLLSLLFTAIRRKASRASASVRHCSIATLIIASSVSPIYVSHSRISISSSSLKGSSGCPRIGSNGSADIASGSPSSASASLTVGQ